MIPVFPSDFDSILKRMEQINPEKYAKTRNFENGAITYLSPYISRGVIDTATVFEYLKSLNLPFYKIEKLVQELAWRDYWQQIWKTKGSAIDQDFKRTQPNIKNHGVPAAIVEARTGIQAVDQAIVSLKETGYMHNHMRMYVASICCNIGGSHWSNPAKWMYSLLLDGDWASNALSWQWVAGSNANKKYFANQDNINKYFSGAQKNSFLDTSYENLVDMDIPPALTDLVHFEKETVLGKMDSKIYIQEGKKTLIYNFYNLDPLWHKEADCNRILLLEPSLFEKYPVSEKVMSFVLALKENISDVQVFIGDFVDLYPLIKKEEVIFKEHPSNRGYIGTEEPRNWMFSVQGYYPSFFKFWNKCKKEIKS